MATRTCDNAQCGATFTSGYLVGADCTYCSEECAVADLGESEYQEALDNDEAFWTDWSEEDEEGESEDVLGPPLGSLPTVLALRESPQSFDAVEISVVHWTPSGCWDSDPSGVPSSLSAFAVYVHCRVGSERAKHEGGGVENVADFPTYSLALAFAQALGSTYGLSVRDFVDGSSVSGSLR